MDGPLGFLGQTSSVSWHMTSAEDCGPARRVVALPPGLLGDLRGHLTAFVAPDAGALVFTGPKGAALRRSNFQKCWIRALTAAGLDDRGLHSTICATREIHSPRNPAPPCRISWRAWGTPVLGPRASTCTRPRTGTWPSRRPSIASCPLRHRARNGHAGVWVGSDESQAEEE